MIPVDEGNTLIRVHSQEPRQFPANILARQYSSLAGGAVGIA